MFIEIHSKAEERNPETRGKKTFVNFKLKGKFVKLKRDHQPHIDSPPWYVSVKGEHTYTDMRPEWDPVTRKVEVLLTPHDIDLLVKELLRQGLLSLDGLKVDAA